MLSYDSKRILFGDWLPLPGQHMLTGEKKKTNKTFPVLRVRYVYDERHISLLMHTWAVYRVPLWVICSDIPHDNTWLTCFICSTEKIHLKLSILSRIMWSRRKMKIGFRNFVLLIWTLYLFLSFILVFEFRRRLCRSNLLFIQFSLIWKYSRPENLKRYTCTSGYPFPEVWIKS